MTKHLALSDSARDVLARSTITADRVVLPEQLDPALYQSIVKVLKNFGGKWNRKEGALLFPSDPRTHIKALVDGEKVVDKKKSNAFFATPDDVAD